MLTKDQAFQYLDEHGPRISIGAYIDNVAVEQVNPEVRRTAASLIKPFIFYFVLKNREIFQDNISIDEIPLTNDTILRFFTGSLLNLNGLLSLMIDISDNAVSNYFLDRAGMGTINGFLKSEGFKGTTFGRRFLDSEARKAGNENYTTVSDLRRLFHGILSGKLLGDEERRLFVDILKTQFDRSKFAFYLPEAIESGGKSGVLDNVWNDLIFFEEGGKNVMLIALTENMPGSTARDLLASYSYHFIKERFPESLK